MLTTTIGAYPKPDAVPIRDWFGMDGGTDTAEPTAGYAETLAAHAGTIEAVLDRATREVVAEQVELGIDIPTDGEIRRENFIHYHCRHLVGIDFEVLTEQRRGGTMKSCCRRSPARSRPARRSWCATGRSRSRLPGGRSSSRVPGPLTIGEARRRRPLPRPARAWRRAGRCAERRDPAPGGRRLPGHPGRRAGVRAQGRGCAGLRHRAPRALLPQGAPLDRARGPRLLRLSRSARCRGLPEGAAVGLSRACAGARRGADRRGLDRGRAPAERSRPARALRQDQGAARRDRDRAKPRGGGRGGAGAAQGGARPRRSRIGWLRHPIAASASSGAS